MKNTPNMTGMMPVMLPALASSSACCNKLPPDLPVCRQHQRKPAAAPMLAGTHQEATPGKQNQL
jgi:hypothetical protein